MVMRYRWLTLQGAALLLFVGGCSSPSAADINFITQKPSDGPQMLALLEGKLILSERCLRIESSGGGESHAAIWPVGYSFSADEAGVHIISASTQVVARVGNTIRVGGGEVPHPSDEAFAQGYLGDSQCPGTYWIVSDDVEIIAP